MFDDDDNMLIWFMIICFVFAFRLGLDAVHPNYSSLHDRDHQPSLLNGGVVIKTNCCNRYATTAYTSTLLKEIARLSNVPLQVIDR
jgi:aspartyl aminopeptidase